MNNSRYAFYGSLRRGMENHPPFEKNLQYLFSARLKGFRMHTSGQYPFVVKTNDQNSIVVEVYRITSEETERAIHQLEIDEGYYLDFTDIDGVPTGIYLYDSRGNYPEVTGGDWVTFFREKVNQK